MDDLNGWRTISRPVAEDSGHIKVLPSRLQAGGMPAADSGWHTKRQKTLPLPLPQQQQQQQQALLDAASAAGSAPAAAGQEGPAQHAAAAPIINTPYPTGPPGHPGILTSDWQQHRQQHLQQQQQQQQLMPPQQTAAFSAPRVAPAAGGLAGEGWVDSSSDKPARPLAAAAAEISRPGLQPQMQMQLQDDHGGGLWGGGDWGMEHSRGQSGQQQQQQQQGQQQGRDEDELWGWGAEEGAVMQYCNSESLQQQQQHEEEDGGIGSEEQGEDADQTEGERDEEEAEDDEEVQLESADFDVSRDEVIQRIEQLTFELITAAADGQLPTLTCISTAASNVHMAPRDSLATTTNTDQGLAPHSSAAQGSGLVGSGNQDLDLDSTQEAAAAAAAFGNHNQQQQQQQHVVRLGSKVQTRSLLANNGAQANSIVRALQLLDSVHGLLRAGRTSTQRDIYYTLVGRPGYERPRDVTSAIQSVLGMLRVPRAALGISAASKGAVAGCVLLRSRVGEAWVDCRSVGPSGRPIPGEVGAVDALTFRSAGARCILVVEKDAVFQSLVESRLHEALPCIIITGRGMPDVASRAFLAAVVEASRHWGIAATAATGGSFSSLSSQAFSWQQQQQPSLPVLGVVDWNPGGVSILLAYKYGCAALGLESARYAVPSLSWLGVTSEMLQEGSVPQSRCHALSSRDKALLPNLKARLASCPDWVEQLEEMEGLGLKADIEALQHEELMGQLQRRILQGRYLH